MYLSRFTSRRPLHLVPQDKGLRWLAEAHGRANGSRPELMYKLLERFGCDSRKIATRATYLDDFTHLDWERMLAFSPDVQAKPLARKMAVFNEVATREVEALYDGDPGEFNHWIHVTCTGYVSPSPIQTVASRRGWGSRIQCLHAYHMGCYAALPALRMARGNLDCEIVHTEFCTLHLQPANTDPEQLVIQTLFADGAIRYLVSERKPETGFECMDAREWIAPDSLKQMTWDVSTNGFAMTLSREVPKSVEQCVRGLLEPWLGGEVHFAIHPGGPRIIDAVKAALQLSEEQVRFSREILHEYGNMSSATLPHIWERMLPQLPPGSRVVSVAFGPGLTLSAALMRKVGA